jgi:aspartyl-tRNA(Asn)/glutamyl-tRNA(Gln) amidotransferase subunit A
MPETPLTITDAAAQLRDGTTTSVELTSSMLSVADQLDPQLGTFITRYPEAAMEAAAVADAELAAGDDRGPLHGIPIGVKDIIACKEGPTTGQSVIYDPDWYAGQDAPVVARLRTAGAVIVGKTTTMEYACGFPDASKPYPVPRNAWDPETWPGGSSSGSGSGVAAGMFLGALGTDTGGSVRMPASYSGISGMKQTYGLVPKNGCYPLGVTNDHIGPMARSAADCAEMLKVMAGYDPGDPSCIPGVTAEDYPALLDGDLSGLTVGVARQDHLDQPFNDPALEGCFEAAVAVLEEAGATVVEVVLPYYDEAVTVGLVCATTEAYAYHSQHLKTRWADYGRPTRDLLGQGALTTGADYAQALKARRIICAAAAELFATVDLVVTPSTATGAFRLDELTWETAWKTWFMQYWNVVGYPALSVPMGFTAGGLPLGLQLVGAPMADALVMRAGDAYQQHTSFHLTAPAAVVPA